MASSESDRTGLRALDAVLLIGGGIVALVVAFAVLHVIAGIVWFVVKLAVVAALVVVAWRLLVRKRS